MCTKKIIKCKRHRVTRGILRWSTEQTVFLSHSLPPQMVLLSAQLCVLQPHRGLLWFPEMPMLHSTQVSSHTLWFPSGKRFLFHPYLSLRAQLQSLAQGTFLQYPCLGLPPFYKRQSTTAIFLAFISVGDYRFLAWLLDDHFSPPPEWVLYKIKDCILFCLPTQYRVDMQENWNEWGLCTVYAFPSLETPCSFSCSPPLFTSPWTSV